MVILCDKCQRCQSKQLKEALLVPEAAATPWHIITSDLFHHDSKEYQLVSDTYSKCQFIKKLHTTTSTSIIHQLKELFSEHGMPEILKSDYGPQYASQEFANFAS